MLRLVAATCVLTHHAVIAWTTPTAAASFSSTHSRSRTVTATATASPAHAQYPSTYSVPGLSVFDAFFGLIEFTASISPFVGEGRQLEESADGRQPLQDFVEAEEARNDAAMRETIQDASLSLYERSRSALKLVRRAAMADSAAELSSAHGRSLLGGNPSINAANIAALFCDFHNASELGWWNSTTRWNPPQGGPVGYWAMDGGRRMSAWASSTERHSTTGARSLQDPGFDDAVWAFPGTRYIVEEWCTLARFQPHVLGLLGMAVPKTVFIPDFFGFFYFDTVFPAWYEWLTSFPSCIAGFNRMEYFLQLHATLNNVTCGPNPGVNGSYHDFASANIKFSSPEVLRIARVIEPGVTDATTCKLDTLGHFDWHSWATPNVRAQFIGNDGNILVIDKPLTPEQHPLMRYPTQTALEYIFAHPHMTTFSEMLVLTGVADVLAIAPYFNPHLIEAIGDDFHLWEEICRVAFDTGHGHHHHGKNSKGVSGYECRNIFRWLYNNFHSVTVFAPTDDVFAALSPMVLSQLTDPSNLELLRYVVLSHFLNGQTYLYDCSFADVNINWGSVAQRTASNSILNITGSYASTWGAGSFGNSNDGGGRRVLQDVTADNTPTPPLTLLLNFMNSYNPSPFAARTVPPWVNVETTTGIVNTIDGVLIDGCAWQAILNGLVDTSGDEASCGAKPFNVLQCQCDGHNPFPEACERDNDLRTDADSIIDELEAEIGVDGKEWRSIDHWDNWEGVRRALHMAVSGSEVETKMQKLFKTVNVKARI